MENIYSQFADWQKIDIDIPISKFYEDGKMTDKQKNKLIQEVTKATILYKKDDAHVMEMEVRNVYCKDGYTYGWVSAVFQTMPYEITLVLNCKSKYYLFLKADTHDRQKASPVLTDKVVTNIYGNKYWIDIADFDYHDLKIYDKPIYWKYFPSIYQANYVGRYLTFTDCFDGIVKVPYPRPSNVSAGQVDLYLDYAKNEYELFQGELDYFPTEDQEYMLSEFWHDTEFTFKSRLDDSEYDNTIYENEDRWYCQQHAGYVDGELVYQDSFDRYVDDYGYW